MSRGDTKERILDAAERLFAREGFHGTSLRTLTGEAKVNLAAVNYHFGSKEALLEAVFERRILPLNKVRRENLEKVGQMAAKEGRRPGVRETLHAFIEPGLRFKKAEPGSKDFITLVGRAFAAPDDTVRKVLMRFMRPMFLLLFNTLSEALPELPQDVLLWRINFTIGAMAHVMHIKGKFRLGPMSFNTDCDTDSLIAMLVDFVTAGVMAP